MDGFPEPLMSIGKPYKQSFTPATFGTDDTNEVPFLGGAPFIQVREKFDEDTPTSKSFYLTGPPLREIPDSQPTRDAIRGFICGQDMISMISLSNVSCDQVTDIFIRE